MYYSCYAEKREGNEMVKAKHVQRGRKVVNNIDTETEDEATDQDRDGERDTVERGRKEESTCRIDTNDDVGEGQDPDPNEGGRIKCSTPLTLAKNRRISFSDTEVCGYEYEPVKKRARVIGSSFTSADRELLVRIDKRLEQLEKFMSSSDKKVGDT